MIAVRLSDVAVDDEATRVTYGLLNLTHRDGHDEPKPLELPIRAARDSVDAIRDPGPPRGAPAGRTTLNRPRDYGWTVVRDLAADCSTLEVKKDEGEFRFDELQVAMQVRTTEWYSHTRNDYDSVRGEVECVRGMSRGDWSISVRTRTVLTSDCDDFHLRAEMDGYEGDQRVHSHNVDRSIPRDLM
ncbi:CocE/NonD family hydrolase C-terminal non-catalytic domain-containing protein [Aquisalimonas sp.]|uniref:CocE/NonD family hydrolase C-terminal non-catalytic domain-containing protein n=1 Tax=Aquisalimonas sp. TaxID=1872621 RepID=UPI0025C478E2|nr:CocE/NonD family hydrolase C-terminal non-catalytic domain-containing protein [Aquisalimonas sp.]